MDPNDAKMSQNTISWAQDAPIWAQIPQNHQKSPKVYGSRAFGRLQDICLKDFGSLGSSKWSPNDVKSHDEIEKATKVKVVEFIGPVQSGWTWGAPE